LAYSVTALEHLGKYGEAPWFDAFHGFSNRAYAAFHEGVPDDLIDSFSHLIRRMIYIAEGTSVALRLVGSWGLSHPSFSLCRDRYEQCVRFSWLARQPDDAGWSQYIADILLRRSRLKNAFASRGISMPELDDGLEGLPNGAREAFRRWDKLALEQLAKQRDGLPGVTNTNLDSETLLTFYDSIYRQGSSVAHYDFYSIQMLDLFKAPDGQIVLAAHPGTPIVMALHCALFDLIQCAEALAKLDRPAGAEFWNSQRAAFWDVVRDTGIMDDHR
jgi:hypothetical protein